MGKRIVIDEAVEMLFECTGHFARTTGAWAISHSLRSLMGKALDPLSQGRIGNVEGLGDGRDVLARDHLTDGLGPATDPGLLGLFEYGC
jgi:hypothetical protein